MGSGKTTVGPPLAQRLARRFVDNDEVLTSRTGRSAAEIVASDGADALHREEAAALLDALDANQEPAVVAAAGSVVVDDAVRERLRGDDIEVVWLRAHPSTLRRRALAGAHRPFVHDDPSAVARLDGERRPRYQEVADVVVDVDDREAVEIVDEVVKARP
jgi:shikimate kinase